ncbi:TetR/AcrR family transcriptional regulator [Undibacterium luofuense]|uniref:TetR/AcrR family transcriptional regulator n=1 Tax=Undibacterium luofuense TaxID=2828733 RepID=UPI0030ED16AD
MNDPQLHRADGAQARQRLLETALRMFAEKGYAKTSVRELAKAAQVNVSAVSYYFGDKAALYRAVFNDPQFNPTIDPAYLQQEDLPLEQGIKALIFTLAGSLRDGEKARDAMTLHCREMLEPTGLWNEEIETSIKPAHLAFAAFLCRHLGLKKPDDDIHRLTFAIVGLPVSLMISSDLVQVIRPQLFKSDAAIDLFMQRMVGYAVAMVEAERQRRAG